jgi:hypothetical protein
VPWLQEVYRAKPAPDGEGADLKARRGWWPPTRDELRERARRLRETKRAQRSREAARKPSADA